MISLPISIFIYFISFQSVGQTVHTFHPVTLILSFLIAPSSLVCLSCLAGIFFPDQCSEYLFYLVFEYCSLFSLTTYFVDIPPWMDWKQSPANPHSLSFNQYRGEALALIYRFELSVNTIFHSACHTLPSLLAQWLVQRYPVKMRR